MLVIHPYDKTTEFLKLLYDSQEVTLIDQNTSNSDVKSLLNHAQKHERIMLLGHGSEKGLYSRENCTKDEFDRLMISHQHRYYLRRLSGRLIGIWCNANAFARKEGIHGLFSGMVISETEEAEEYGFKTTPEALEEENLKLAANLSIFLREGTPLHLIPGLMSSHKDIHDELTRFNYNNFHYL